MDLKVIDKAPGEETALDTENVAAETQKDKNKVDGDPSKKVIIFIIYYLLA
jgi:hypothetical protein